ncbi:MAG TPA: VOC family protein [Thermoleophilaceae bacterium]
MIAVADLAAAGREIEARHGLASIEGGRHPGWGTANRIVPLGDTFIELIAVIDEAEAAGSAFGSWVAAGATPAGRLLGWAVRSDDLDDVAARLGLTVAANSRKDASGRTLRWRVAGIEQAAAEPSLPFFLEWGDGTPLPGRAPATHHAGSVKIAGLELDGDAERVEHWLGSHSLPISVRAGAPAVARVILTGTAGEFALKP